MSESRILFITFIILNCCATLFADLDADMQAASAKLAPSLKDAETLMSDGEIEQANAKILGAFPEASRTATEALLLGNVLYKQDPKSSYALHKRAANELVGVARPQLEWAMEQHRAGEYEPAAATYEKFIQLGQQNFAPAYGLQAECLIRIGKIPEAVKAWQMSEKATGGTLDDFETFVCEVHTKRQPHRQRAELLTKAKAGDIDAAEKLIGVDIKFERDWWNDGPQYSYLMKDVASLRAAKFTSAARLKEIVCAADCKLMARREGADVAAFLRQRGYLFDTTNTLPGSGVMLSSMLSDALDSKAITLPAARTRWGPAILAKARASKDAEMYNVAARLYIKTEQLPQIDEQGWDATGDERFAASWVLGKSAKGALKVDDPRLIRARKEFPENAQIAREFVLATKASGQPLKPALIDAIKAEYSRFSYNAAGIDLPRPSARMLRTYFETLAREIAAK